MPLAAELNQAETRWFTFIIPVDRGDFTLILGWKFSPYTLQSKDQMNRGITLENDTDKNITLGL